MGFENQQLSFEQLLEQVKQLDASEQSKLIEEVIKADRERKLRKAILDDFERFKETFQALA